MNRLAGMDVGNIRQHSQCVQLGDEWGRRTSSRIADHRAHPVGTFCRPYVTHDEMMPVFLAFIVSADEIRVADSGGSGWITPRFSLMY